MTKDQADVLNIVQEVLRGVVTSCCTLNPDRTADMSAMLLGFAQVPSLSPVSKQMLEDLAQAPGLIASAGAPKQ